MTTGSKPTPGRTRPTWLDTGRIPAMDGLRAVAILLVVTAHASQTAGFPAIPGVYLLRIGAAGVDVFFVLSGFLITTLLYREWERTGRVSLWGFYGRRALRIVPAFAALLVFVASLQAVGAAAVSDGDWLAALTYTMNFRPQPGWELGHLWSLSIEEHFYLVWPVLFIALPPRAAARLLVATLITGPALRWLAMTLRPDLSPRLDLWTPTRLDAISVGCLVALVARTPVGVRRLDAVTRRWPAALACLAISLAGARLSGKFAVGVAPTLTAVSLGALVWVAARRAPRWLEFRLLAVGGIGSYSLYLWQQPFLDPSVDHWWTAFPQNILFAGASAAISYALVERTFLRLKKSRDLPLPECQAPGPKPALVRAGAGGGG